MTESSPGTAREHRPPPVVDAEPPRAHIRSRRLLILLGLTGFAISQPLLSIAGENPTLFVFNDVGRGQIILGAVLLTLLPPLVLWLAVTAAGRVAEHVEQPIFLTVSGLLLSLAGVQWGRELDLGAASWGLGVGVGLAGAAGLARLAVVREWATFTAILPGIALLTFFFLSPTSDLLGAPSAVERNEIAGVEPDLVIVLFDELPTATLINPDGSMNESDFPNFAELADESTWYRNFTTTSARTQTALPAMLTGRLPQSRQPLWTNYPDNLFRFLAPSHGLTVHESFTQLCGIQACTEAGPTESAEASSRPRAAVDQLFDLWTDHITGSPTAVALDDFEELVNDAEDEPADNDLAIFADDDQVRRQPTRLTEFLDALGPADDPHAFFLHLILPHIPFRWYPDGTQYRSEPDPIVTAVHARSEPWLIAIDEQRHTLQTQYTDRLLGTVIGELKAKGIYDESVVVVVADHGLSFALDENRRSLGEEGLAGTAFVPLFVKDAGQVSAVVDDQNLQSHDLLPLIAARLGLEIPWEVDGAAPGSATIAARGSTKIAYPSSEGIANASLEDPFEYAAEEYPPTAAAHALAPRAPDDPQLGPLLDLLDAAALVGTVIDDADAPTTGRIEVLALDDVRSTTLDLAQPFIQGTIVSGPDDGEILFAVDDRIVTGSMMFDAEGKTRFLAMLPSDVAGTGFELRALIVAPDGSTTEPEVTG